MSCFHLNMSKLFIHKNSTFVVLSLLTILRILAKSLSGDFLKSRCKIEYLLEQLSSTFVDSVTLFSAYDLLAIIGASYKPHGKKMVQIAVD